MSSPVFDPLLGEMVLHEHAASATPPGGSDTQFQYNNAGAFGGTAKLVFDGTYIKFPSLPTSDPFVEGAAWNSSGTLKISNGPNVWWLAGGISAGDCLAAYQAKGAASLAASYSNLNNPGTNDATLGVAPSWAAGTGWTFNGTDQYLLSSVPVAGESLLVQFSMVAASQSSVVGMDEGGTMRLNLYPKYNGDNRAYYRSGGSGDVATGYLSGNIATTPTKGYKDGAVDVALTGSWSGTATRKLAIGGINGAVFSSCACVIIAVARYSRALSDSEVAAVAAAMAAL